MSVTPVLTPTQQRAVTPGDVWHAARRSGCAVALWRDPGAAAPQAVVDLSGGVRVGRVDLSEVPAGFVLSPFDNPGGARTRFIRADVHYRADRPTPLRTPTEAAPRRTDFLRALGAPAAPVSLPPAVASPAANVAARPYQRLVGRAVEAIRQGAFRKVVLSRRRTVPLPSSFDAPACFERLCAAYPRAFVSLFWVPGEGAWVCATPETLVSLDAAGTFRTMALAGTQRLPTHQPLSSAVWTQKEIEEQALVSRYIVNCFKKIRLREFEEEGPRTVAAGNLIHLRTDFSVDTRAQRYPQLATVMLDLLHPTSAVCGMPREAATAFLRAHEGYDRAYYSGYLGPVNLDAPADQPTAAVYVHLRCARLMAGRAWLYAGGGITVDSVPEREWHETEMKCETLLNFLK